MERYEHIEHTVWTEPRIQFIKRQLESLLKIVDLETNGQVVKIDGFRLKDLSMWRCPIPMSILSNFGSFSSFCNCKCEFCYERGFPKVKDKLVFSPKKPMLTLREARTRVRCYDPESKTGLFVTASDSLEPTLNPNWLDILRLARERCPDQMLDLPSTNGTKLTEGVIRQLEELKPIRVAVSLHSANPSIRKKVMRDPCPEVAIQSIPLLRKYRIQFGVGIVPWPTIPFKDVEETIRYADRYDPLEIQIQLPGFTRFGFESPPFDTREQWDTAIT